MNKQSPYHTQMHVYTLAWTIRNDNRKLVENLLLLLENLLPGNTILGRAKVLIDLLFSNNEKKIETLNGKKQQQFIGITYPNDCKMRPKKQIVKVMCNENESILICLQFIWIYIRKCWKLLTNNTTISVTIGQLALDYTERYSNKFIENSPKRNYNAHEAKKRSSLNYVSGISSSHDRCNWYCHCLYMFLSKSLLFYEY